VVKTKLSGSVVLLEVLMVLIGAALNTLWDKVFFTLPIVVKELRLDVPRIAIVVLLKEALTIWIAVVSEVASPKK